ncbi:MAG: DUF1684 domain-containing protein [Bacteroidota bacterium]
MRTFLKILPVLFLCFAMSCGDEGDGATAEFDADELLKSRTEHDAEFKTAGNSPIPQEIRSSFKGLNYFPPNEEYALPAFFTRFENPQSVKIQTSKANDIRTMSRYGELAFVIAEKEYKLTVFKTNTEGQESYLFVPFKDATTGRETYEGGRYIDLEEQEGDDEYLLDFNRAYNPYCAYNHKYACPLVPAENVLKIAIPAGEKAFKK